MSTGKIFKVMKGEPVVLEHLRYPILVSPKLNGVRGYVRNGKVWSTANKLLPNVHLQETFCRFEYLDGEFIVGDPSDTQNSLNRTTSVVMSDDKPIDGLKFYAFDHIADTDAPFSARLVLMKLTIKEARSKLLVPIEHATLTNEVALLGMEARYLEQGYEGLITRDPNAPYKFGKSTAKQAWMGKLKRFVDDEAEIIGFEEGQKNNNEKVISETGRSKRSSAKAGKVGKNTLGSLACRWKNGKIFNIGTGFTDAEKDYIWANQSKYLGQLAKFKYFELGSGDVPILPVWLGLRDRRDL